MRINLEELDKEGDLEFSFFLVYTKNAENNQLDVQVFDHWSNDTCQDAWFTASSLHIVSQAIKRYIKFGYNVDNEDNIESAVKDIAGVQVVNLNPNRNNGKVKLQLVYVVKLEIDLIFIINLDKTKLGTITGISNLQEWIWPTDEEKVSYIHAYALLGIEE
ncbi:hypothetical protein GLOIN_2v1790442 [Rhizophagus clarus]|uniref:Uncharacterized protein n=1 Tax=Rhizophagus clarus TaxID=94130 RepID=A0A8H3ME16_9GLOM|nr:hypothetical protein GLOIN_2v1790442 [Rhizophagus clarus]